MVKKKKAITHVKKDNFIEEVYTPEVIPDKTEEIIREINASKLRMDEQADRDYKHRQLLKQNRILGTKKDKYLHAIDLIIEWAGKYQDQNNSILFGKTIGIDYYLFNFEDRLDVVLNLFKPFLNKLKNDGCFTSWKRHTFVKKSLFTFFEVDIDKLKEYRNNFEANTGLSKIDESYSGLTKRDLANWHIGKDGHSGYYEISKEIRIPFRGSRFGGINELIKNSGHEITRDQLRKAINDYTQGGKKKDLNKIVITKWIDELNRGRKDFAKYFKIEHRLPHFYCIKLKDLT